LTLVHFCVVGLDLLGFWDQPEETVEENHGVSKSAIVDWILSLQNPNDGGFQSAPYGTGEYYCQSHVAMTYCALCCLQTLMRGDPEDIIVMKIEEGNATTTTTTTTTRRRRRKITTDFLPKLQLPNGAFRCTVAPSDCDMRFVYCACSICYMLNDWDGVDTHRTVEYIQRCRSYDGSIGMVPGMEGHGGSTFCAVASLVLMDKLNDVIDLKWKNDLIYWCVQRQQQPPHDGGTTGGGMQGRPNKLEDTCYSYWVGATLRLLGHKETLLDENLLTGYVLNRQFQPTGGFCKAQGSPFPDLLHSFYSLAWLGLANENYNSDDATTTTTTGNDDRIESTATKSTGVFPLHPLNCTLGIRTECATRFGGPTIP
jgi:geranylgeranyl transferase type-1 subunit beta